MEKIAMDMYPRISHIHLFLPWDYTGIMELKRVSFDDFRRAMMWARSNMRKMLIREIKYRTNEEGNREPVINEWYEMHYGDGQLFWTNPSTSFFMDRDRSVKLDRTMRYRLDLLSGRADIRDGKGIYLQIRIEIPDTL